MTPNNSGGFENGPTFGASSWATANAATNQWAVGNGSVNRREGSYIGNATTFVGTNTVAISPFLQVPSTAVPVGAN